MASKISEQVLPPPVDLEETPIHGQLGSAVLDLNGQVVRRNGLLSPHQAIILYKMLLEVGMLPEGGFQKMTVSFASSRYSVVRDESYVYVVVQTQL